MAYEIRKFSIIIAVAVLFAIFAFALANAFVPEIEYPDTCVEAQGDDRYYDQRPLEPRNCTSTPAPTQAEQDACPGRLNLDHSTCEYECYCNEITQEHQHQKDNIIFWIAVVMGGLAIIGGMLLPQKNPLNDWVGTGFVLGGVLTLFIATTMNWSNIDKILRPLVILAELILVLWIAYKRFVPKKE